MRIQIITQTKRGALNDPLIGRWSILPNIWIKEGHIVDYIYRDELPSFYIRYLKFNPDVIISVGPIAGIVAMFRKLFLIRTPVILDWNDDYARGLDEQGGWRYYLAKFLENFAYKNVDLSVVCSKFREERCKKANKKVIYLPHGVHEPYFKEARIMKKTILNSKKFKVISFGRQSKVHKIDRLIEAAKGLKDVDVYLSGKTNPDFQKIATKNVHFLGFIPYQDLVKGMHEADLGVLTMDNDSEVKMHEYAKVGLPILSLKGQIEYTLKHMKNAYITDNLKEGIETLRKDPVLRNKLAKNLSSDISTRSWNQISNEYIRIMRKLSKN